MSRGVCALSCRSEEVGIYKQGFKHRCAIFLRTGEACGEAEAYAGKDNAEKDKAYVSDQEAIIFRGPEILCRNPLEMGDETVEKLLEVMPGQL